jgi:murein L,D-transpeptidase YcbB/YkuD
VRNLRGAICLTAALAALAGAAGAAPQPNAVISDVARIEAFYAARGGAPLWFAPTAAAARRELINLLRTSSLDDIPETGPYIAHLEAAEKAAEAGDADSIRRAESIFSQVFVNYAHVLERDPKVGIIYVDQELKPAPSPAQDLLKAFAEAPSPADYLRNIGWLNPMYGRLRQAAASVPAGDPKTRHQLLVNLERTRALPRGSGPWVMVNTANQRLTMYENQRPVGEMKVVTGRVGAQTPLMNAFIRYAVLNPYWNVPEDITRKLAPKVVAGGKAYLSGQGYEVVSDFTDNPKIIDPSTIDWKAVANGTAKAQMRQAPGPANSMGRVKYMFPNSQGVWLHDTPSRKYFTQDTRLESSGCVRLEDAWRLGSWLMQQTLKPVSGGAEQRVELPRPVPIAITYLTAFPNGSSIEYFDDVYRRDPPPLEASIAVKGQN